MISTKRLDRSQSLQGTPFLFFRSLNDNIFTTKLFVNELTIHLSFVITMSKNFINFINDKKKKLFRIK